MPAISPARAANMATHACMGQLYTEIISIYEYRLCMALPTVHICTACDGLSSSVEAQIRIKFPCVCQLQSSSLWVAMLHSDCQASTGLHMLHNIDLREIFEYAHLKFTVMGQASNSSKQTYTHSHVCNTVTLVWGLLRLAPKSAAKKGAHISSDTGSGNP